MSRASFTLFGRLNVCELFGVLALGFAAVPVIADEVLSDPTRPPAVVAAELAAPEAAERTSALSLQAIFFAEGRRVAIINDRRVRERDLVEGARLVRIARDHVELQRGEERLELRLISGGVKQGASDTRTSPAIRSHARSHTAITPLPKQDTLDSAAPNEPEASSTHASTDDPPTAGPQSEKPHVTTRVPASPQQGMSP